MAHDPYLLVLFVALAAAHDLRELRIPNRLIALGLAAALVQQLAAGPPAPALAAYFGGALLGAAVFLPLYLARGMAAGDVKLMAMVGAFAGPAQTLRIALATMIAGGLLALATAAASGQLRSMLIRAWRILRLALLRLAGAELAPEPAAASIGGMPYGLAIAAGTLCTLLGQAS